MSFQINNSGRKFGLGVVGAGATVVSTIVVGFGVVAMLFVQPVKASDVYHENYEAFDYIAKSAWDCFNWESKQGSRDATNIIQTLYPNLGTGKSEAQITIDFIHALDDEATYMGIDTEHDQFCGLATEVAYGFVYGEDRGDAGLELPATANTNEDREAVVAVLRQRYPNVDMLWTDGEHQDMDAAQIMPIIYGPITVYNKVDHRDLDRIAKLTGDMYVIHKALKGYTVETVNARLSDCWNNFPEEVCESANNGTLYYKWSGRNWIWWDQDGYREIEALTNKMAALR